MEKVELRVIFGNCLKEFMEKDERVLILDADLAKASGTIGLRDIFPDRAIDVGVQEQNMASIAGGLASYGFIPFIATFTPFATRRMCDQVALSINYARQNVKIVGIDPGIAAELNGGTHMSLEDIGVIRSMPTMVIYEPVDGVQLEQALPQILEYNGPVYIRMFRKYIEDVFNKDTYKFDLFKADTIKEGKDVTIFATGIMVQETVEAIKILEKEGIDAEFINIHTIKPIDKDAIIASARKTNCVVTAENHNVIGGLYSAVSEVLSADYPVPMRAIGVNDYFGEVGKMPYLKDRYNMNATDIVAKCREVIALKKA